MLPGQNYAENIAAPFGSFAGGKWFVAQGWWLTGVQAADSKNYQLVSHTGVTETPPTSIAIQIGGVVAGDYVLVARDNGSGGFANDTTLASSATAGATSVTLTAAPADTPVAPGSQTCYIRINGNRHTYTGRSGNTISGLSPAVPAGGSSRRSRVRGAGRRRGHAAPARGDLVGRLVHFGEHEAVLRRDDVVAAQR